MGYQLKITIRGSKPPIWRRIIVPDRITFANLDAVIESVFGWTHEHLYEFYFQEENVRFAFDPYGYGQGNVETECIDAWMWEGRRCVYTYDFGDDWQHDLVVERIVPYDYRYATVAKSKGPYMIEDCGGIWSFYEYIEEAEEFDLEYANQVLQKMEFDKAEPSDENEELEEFFKSAEGRGMLLNEMNLMMNEMHERKVMAEDWINRNKDSKEVLLLESVLMKYSKKELTSIARVNGFSGYSSLKKAELAKWIASHLLDGERMRVTLDGLSRIEIEIFEKAIDNPAGIWVSEKIMENSLFLCSYGMFNMSDVLRIPNDVREKYQEICTMQYRSDRNRKWLIADYCESAGYLYGVIPIDKLAEIYLGYEGGELPAEDIINLITEVVELGGSLHREGELLIHEELLEENVYQLLLEIQGNISYYIPSDREEFLAYGEEDGGNDDDSASERMEEFVEFLQLKYQLEEPFAKMVYYDLEHYIHIGYDMESLMGIFAECMEQYGKNFSEYKQVKDAEKRLRKLWNHTRVLSYRGYTRAEVRNLNGKSQFSVVGKIYPNDPCPCGSGKKYKYCCGKKK